MSIYTICHLGKRKNNIFSLSSSGGVWQLKSCCCCAEDQWGNYALSKEPKPLCMWIRKPLNIRTVSFSSLHEPCHQLFTGWSDAMGDPAALRHSTPSFNCHHLFGSGGGFATNMQGTLNTPKRWGEGAGRDPLGHKLVKLWLSAPEPWPPLAGWSW